MFIPPSVQSNILAFYERELASIETEIAAKGKNADVTALEEQRKEAHQLVDAQRQSILFSQKVSSDRAALKTRISPISNFDRLSESEAENVLCQTVLPMCEKVFSKRVLSVGKIQKAFSTLAQTVESSPRFIPLSTIKEAVVKVMKSSISNDNLIAALLLQGHQGKFLENNCRFNVKIINS